MTGLAKAFAAFGAVGKNKRWSWSARTPDDQTVVMTFWKDAIDYSSDPITYSTFGSPRLHIWKDKPGNRERIENLKWARDRCEGLMKVVIIEAKDIHADVGDSIPLPQLERRRAVQPSCHIGHGLLDLGLGW